MFAPEGYAPFSEISNDAFDRRLYGEAREYIVNNTNSLLKFAVERREDLILHWLLDYCKESLYVSNLDGKILKVDGEQLFSHRFYVDLSGRLLSEMALPEVPQDMVVGFNMCSPLNQDEIDRFNELVEDYYSDGADSEAIDQLIRKSIDDGAATGGFTKPPLFVNFDAGTVDLSLYRWLCQFDGTLEKLSSDGATKIHSCAERLAHVEGWYLCVPQHIAGHPWQDFCENRGQKHKAFMDEIIGSDSMQLGRPKKRDAAAEAFRVIYPHGLGSDTWPMAARKVSGVIGEVVAIDTIKRGLGLK